jgi:hypothetical protein
MLSGSSRFRASVMVFLALLKHRSHSADITGINKASKAILDRFGHLCALVV